MQKPDFSKLAGNVKNQIDNAEKRNNPSPTARTVYNCQCCQDTGIVQTWKLNTFIEEFKENPLDPITSYPVFCQHKKTCGNTTLQIYSGWNSQEDEQTRTVESSLFELPNGSNTTIGRLIGENKAMCLSYEQAKYIHDQVLLFARNSKEANQVQFNVSTILQDL